MSTLLIAPSPSLRVWKTGPVHWVVIALSVGAAILAFLPVLTHMRNTWDVVEEYSYGYFIPVITAFLIWQRSDVLRRQPFAGDLSGLALIAFALLLRWVSDASAIRMIGQYGFVIALFGIAVCTIGWRRTRIIAVPLAILLFMIPLPQFVLREVSLSLQLISSELGVWLIRLFGISVHLEGNVIDLGSYKLQVVEACNGLRYLFPLMVLGFLSAYFFQGAMWKRVLLVVVTIPLTIVINSLRIGLIGVTVEYWGRDMAEGLVHDFEGYFMFLICLALLLGLMVLLARTGSGPKRKLIDVFGIEMPEPVAKGVQPASHPLSLASMACALVLVTTSVLVLTKVERPQTAPPRATFAEFPLKIDGLWEGRLDRIEPEVLGWLAVTDYFIANYQRASGPWVNFYVAYYASQSGGESTHSPRTCIPGGGWAISNIEEVAVKLPQRAAGSAAAPSLLVNRAIIQKGEHKQLVYYWFDQRGRNLTNEIEVKWYVLRDSIANNRSDGALVRLVTPVLPNEPEALADQRLAAFLGAVEPRLPAYIPR